ncbi:OmpA family protein [Sphingobacterium spiritivorum]|uniref:OmpA family protein n=1 Tax=Sphingobacterium spiritivorum TaxID=258 RepID=UPI003DA57A4F
MRYSLVLIFICVFCYSFAQKPSGNAKAQQLYTSANRHLQKGEYPPAIELLKEAVKIDGNFASAYQTLGDLYRKADQYEEARQMYEKVLETDPELTPLTYFGIGESSLFTGHYKEALHYLETYKNKVKLADKSALLVNKYIADCNFSLSYSSQDTFVMNKLSDAINSTDDEYFPKLTADNRTIIFTRKTANQENFYESHYDGQIWSQAQKLTGHINSDQFNEGAHCISPDGKYLFFTGCNWPNGMGSCDIYISKKENGIWGEPYNLGAPINSKGWESQPAISADGRTLYFVSNRPGGVGGYDIWKSTLNAKEEWSVPVNLGPQINTIFDESAPYIHADNSSLFFASNGWPGFGRKDIFISKSDSLNKWSASVNLGHPINNYYEQNALYVSMNGKMGFLSTQIDGQQQLDIYSFDIPVKNRPHPVAFIKGLVLDAKTLSPLKASITVTNTATNQVVFQDQSDITDGEFLATLPIGNHYAVHVREKGYLFESIPYALDDPRHTNEEFEARILLKPIEVDKNVVLNNIFFALNKYDLLPSSTSDLNTLVMFLQENPLIRIEIGGHTDNTGNDQLNKTLSDNRAKAVVSYLIARGISANRLLAKGYGSNQPLAANDTEAGKALNRRTEFKIIK